MYKVYLSGPISGLTFDEAEDWRKTFKACMNDNITALDPLRCKEFLQETGQVIDGNLPPHSVVFRDEFIGMRDEWDTTRSDAIIVNLLGARTASVGTILEIGMARNARVPILLIMEDDDNVHEHCMIRAYATMRFNNVNDCLDAVNALFSV